MIESIFSWLTNALVGAMDKLLGVFLRDLGFDVTSIVQYIDFLPKLYLALQSVAWGLIIAIAIFQLSKFFVGSLSETKDTPLQIGVRSAIAAVLVYWGNYFLQLVFDLCSYPMDVFFNLSAKQENIIQGSVDSMETVAEWGITGAAMTLLTLVMVIVLGYSLFKLLIEAVERWLVLCLITYTAPLAYATVASKATMGIFQRWTSMIIGQCVLLWSNVWMVKGLLSIVASGGATAPAIIFKITLIFALSRVAQRIDTYLQQLGIGAATTGGGLMDEMMAMGMAMTGKRGGKGGGKGATGGILGKHIGKMQEAMASGDVMGGLKTGGLAGAGAVMAARGARMGKRALGDVIRGQKDNIAAKGAEIAGAGLGEAVKHPLAAAHNIMNDAAKGKDLLRNTAENAGLDAARLTMMQGGSLEEAKESAMQAFGAMSGNGILARNTDSSVANRAAYAERLEKDIPQMFADRDALAQSTATAAMERSLRQGNGINTAAQAAMSAYNNAYGSDGAKLSAEQSAAMLDQYTKSATQMQTGACRYRVGSDGSIHNGLGDQVSRDSMNGASNETLARMYAYSADTNNSNAPGGLTDSEQSLVENTFDGSTIAQSVDTAGYEMYKDDIADRGSELADAVIDQDTSIENQAIAQTTMSASSAIDALSQNEDFKDIGELIKNGGEQQLSSGKQKVCNASVGHGEIAFDSCHVYDNGQQNVDRHFVIKTQEAFDKMNRSQQSQFTRISYEGSSAYYVSATKPKVEKMQISDNPPKRGNSNRRGKDRRN